MCVWVENEIEVEVVWVIGIGDRRVDGRAR